MCNCVIVFSCELFAYLSNNKASRLIRLILLLFHKEIHNYRHSYNPSQTRTRANTRPNNDIFMLRSWERWHGRPVIKRNCQNTILMSVGFYFSVAFAVWLITVSGMNTGNRLSYTINLTTKASSKTNLFY